MEGGAFGLPMWTAGVQIGSGGPVGILAIPLMLRLTLFFVAADASSRRISSFFEGGSIV